MSYDFRGGSVELLQEIAQINAYGFVREISAGCTVNQLTPSTTPPPPPTACITYLSILRLLSETCSPEATLPDRAIGLWD